MLIHLGKWIDQAVHIHYTGPSFKFASNPLSVIGYILITHVGSNYTCSPEDGKGGNWWSPRVLKIPRPCAMPAVIQPLAQTRRESVERVRFRDAILGYRPRTGDRSFSFNHHSDLYSFLMCYIITEIPSQNSQYFGRDSGPRNSDLDERARECWKRYVRVTRTEGRRGTCCIYGLSSLINSRHRSTRNNLEVWHRRSVFGWIYLLHRNL